MKFTMVGSRGHWRYVFDSIAEVENLNFSAISSIAGDSNDELMEQIRQSGFQVGVYDSYLEMLDREKPDLVCIDGPFDWHGRMVVEAIRRGINVFCEKPIVLNWSELEQVESALSRHPVKLFSMVGLHYEEPFQRALNMVRAGAIGKVKLISARKSYRLGIRPDYYRKRETYGGTIPWVGSHAFDWILSFSNADFDQVYASQTIQDNHDNGELEIAAQCQCLMANGVIAQATIDFLRPQSAPTHGDDQVRIAGTEGVLEVRHGDVDLLADHEKDFTNLPASRKLFKDICDDIQGKAAALISTESTLALTRMALAAQQAADESKIVYNNHIQPANSLI